MQSSTDIRHNRTNENSNSFHPCTQSNISAPGRKQILPTFSPDIDQFNREQLVQHNTAIQANPPCMSRTDKICLDANGKYVQIAPLNLNNQQAVSF
jgi:hypothetical protein